MKTKLLKLNKIEITNHFKKHPPNSKKLANKRKHVEDTGYFKESIVVIKSGWWLWSKYTLIDGYTTYLIAKNDYKFDRFEVMVVAA